MPEEKNTDVEEQEIETQTAHSEESEVSEAEESGAEAESGDSPEAEALANLTAEYEAYNCLLYTSPSPRDRTRSRMPSSA